MPSRQMRVISAPNTASTAPPARIPRSCVRPEDSLPAWEAASSRLALRDVAIAPSLAQVDLCELVDEDHAELHEPAELVADARAATRAERRELLGEVLHADLED